MTEEGPFHPDVVVTPQGHTRDVPKSPEERSLAAMQAYGLVLDVKDLIQQAMHDSLDPFSYSQLMRSKQYCIYVREIARELSTLANGYVVKATLLEEKKLSEFCPPHHIRE